MYELFTICIRFKLSGAVKKDFFLWSVGAPHEIFITDKNTCEQVACNQNTLELCDAFLTILFLVSYLHPIVDKCQ